MWLRTLQEWQTWAVDVNWARVGFDTETNGLDWYTLDIWGASFADGHNSCYVNLLDNPDKDSILDDMWQRLLSTKTLIGHNLAFDLKVLLKVYGEKVNQWIMGIDLVDTYCADYLLDERTKHSLKGPGGCLDRHLGRNAMEFKEADKAGPKSKIFAEYAEADAVNTLDLWNVLRPKLIAEDLGRVFSLECKFIPVLVEMESEGVYCDKAQMVHIGNELNARKYELLGKLDLVFQDELRKADGFLFGVDSSEDTFNSPAKTTRFLNDKLGFRVDNADVETMEACAEHDERLKIVMEYHRVSKLLSTYIDGLDRYIAPDSRVRPSYKTISSGRCSCSAPNLQNQPKETDEVAGIDARSIWKPFPGKKFLRADYSQFQLRIAAHNANDANMLKAFSEGYDVHMLVANKGKNLGIPAADLKETSPKFKEIKKQYEAVRTQFKAANFGLLFERSANNLAKDWKSTKEEAQAVIDSVFAMFPFLKVHKNKWHEFIRNKGYSMTMFGRRRRFHRPVTESDLRAGWNSTIQGCLSGSQRILTKQYGYQPIEACLGAIDVWDGSKWSSAFCLPSGYKNEYEVTFSNGEVIRCSANHKFLVVNTHGKTRWVKASALKAHERIVRSEMCQNFDSGLILPKDVPVRNKVKNNLAYNYKDLSWDDIKDPYRRGILLGRLASDGSITKHEVVWLIAAHECKIKGELLGSLPWEYSYRGLRRSVERYSVCSTALSRQCKEMDIKNCVPSYVFGNRELLRGYLRGFFDGDGGVCINKPGQWAKEPTTTICLAFGKNKANCTLPWDIQDALHVFGISSAVSVYKDSVRLRISSRHNVRFRQEIGFMNPRKNSKILMPIRSELKLGDRAVVKSVVCTGRAIPMFDVVNSDSGMFAVGGVVTHNTEADIIKIAMRQVWEYLHKNNLSSRLIWQIHDEIIIEGEEEELKAIKADIEHIMCCAVPLRCPVSVDSNIVSSYSEK